MARFRAVAPTETCAETVVPVVLVLGPLVEVWSDDEVSALSARRRYVMARYAWAKSEGLDRKAINRLIKGRAPWSADDPGAPERLAAVGLTTTDLPRLRASASALVRGQHR